MDDTLTLEPPIALAEARPARPGGRGGCAGRSARSPRGWSGCLGAASLVVGLSALAAIPVAQFLSLGYLLEASGRVARSGRLRDGWIGVRRAARVGGIVAGCLALAPAGPAGLVAGDLGRADRPRRPGRPGAGGPGCWSLAVLTAGRTSSRPAPGGAGSGTSPGRRGASSGWPGGSGGGALRRVPRRDLGVRRGAPAPALFPARGCWGSSGRWPGWRCRSPCWRSGGGSRRPGARSGRSGAGDRGAVAAVPAGPVRGRGAVRGPVRGPGGPRAVPPGPLGVRAWRSC